MEIRRFKIFITSVKLNNIFYNTTAEFINKNLSISISIARIELDK